MALVGLPGSGKSSVGRQLARRLGLPFTDSDHVIEQRIGCPIRVFFEREGEGAFRDLEQVVIDELMQSAPGVIATGGGSVLRPVNRERLRAGATVIYLRSAPEEVFRRVRHDDKRPLLQVDDPMERLRTLDVERDPLYRVTAHFVVETGHPTIPARVNLILSQLEIAGVIAGR